MTSPPQPGERAASADSAWRLPPVGSLMTLLAGEGASRVLSFIAIVLLTRRLGPTAWAPVAVAFTIVQFGTLFVELGLRLLGAREVARDPNTAQRLVLPIVSTQLAVALILVGLAVAARLIGVVGEDLGRLLPGFAVSLVPIAFSVPWLFQGLGAMQWVAAPQVARYAAFLALSALLVTSAERATWLPWLEASAVSFGVVVAQAGVKRFGVRISIDRSTAFDRALMHESLPIAASQLVWVARMYLPTLALWYMVARSSVAEFDVSHRLLMVLQAGLSVYLTNLYTPLSRAVQGPRRRFTGLLAGSAGLAGAGALLVAVTLAWRPDLLLGLYGAAFDTAEAASALRLLAILFPVLTLRGHAHYALVALGRQRRELACSVASALVLAVLLVLWIPSAGVRGAATAMLISEAFGLVITAAALGGVVRRLSL